jgi:ATP synthase F1 gamma subunit
MKTVKGVTQELSELRVIHNVVTAYQEIAANHMQEIREQVLTKRDFFVDVNAIYQEVIRSYRREIEKLAKKEQEKASESLSLIKRNGKTVFVFLSANTGLYGSIIRNTFALFLSEMKALSPLPEVVVIGELGKQLYIDAKTGKEATYFTLSDSIVDQKELESCISFLLQYEKIYIYHGQFQSVVSQVPMKANLSGAADAKEAPAMKPTKRYFFEPSLKNIVMFFETEIFSVLMEQTVYESALAKFASRMVALEQAVEKVKDRVTVAERESLRLKHFIQNKKQLNALIITRGGRHTV